MATSTATVTVNVTCPPGPVTCECNSPYDPWLPPAPPIQTCIEEQPAQRITLTSMHVMHTRWGVDGRCLMVRIDRIVRMPVVCELEEYRHCWPQGCSFTFLPPGTYEISIPAQSAYPLEAGTVVDLEVILEPVSAEYLDAVQANNSTNTHGCCDC